MYSVIKRKIFLEESTIRVSGTTWGTIPRGIYFYLNIQLNQTIDNMGLFTDVEFIPTGNTSNLVDYTLLTDKLNASGYIFTFTNGTVPINFNTLLTPRDKLVLRLPEKILTQYYYYGNNILTGATDSKIEDVRSYDKNKPYISGFVIDEEIYDNYKDIKITGVTQICSLDEPKTYVFDATNDLSIGTINQVTGLQYKDFSAATTTILSANGIDIPTSTVRFISEGWNQTNTSLSAFTKEEFLLGINSRPEVENDVFIDRGVSPVLDYHLRLSEIRNLGQLQQYGNGYYKIETI
jgi:hypothetical protein